MLSRVCIGPATVFMLVVLRLTIGWHFFSEGVKHYADPNWTSERELRSSKGPFAPLYHSYLPDFHGFDELLHDNRSLTDSHAVQDWVDRVQSDWDSFRQRFAAHYGLDEAQKGRASQTLGQFQAKVRDWARANEDALATHVHEWQRKETTREAPTGNLPFQKKRIADKQSSLSGEVSGWHSELKALEVDFHNALADVLSDAQRGERPLAEPRPGIELVDGTMTYVILAIGLLLLLGLFTRLTCVAGAGFLLSVVMMQPFWASDTVPTYNQYVEMFALLTLATTRVGRWGGLDFFLAHWFSRSKG